jgi:hypothetical protein
MSFTGFALLTALGLFVDARRSPPPTPRVVAGMRERPVVRAGYAQRWIGTVFHEGPDTKSDACPMWLTA